MWGTRLLEWRLGAETKHLTWVPKCLKMSGSGRCGGRICTVGSYLRPHFPGAVFSQSVIECDMDTPVSMTRAHPCPRDRLL